MSTPLSRPATTLAVLLTLVLAGGISPAVAAVGHPARPYDFDGDGRADLAVGSPGESVGSVAEAGSVTVLAGSASGPTGPGKAFTLRTAGIAGSPRLADAFGAALASADFDGDGRADLAVSAPARRAPHGSSGVVQVLYGTSAGLSTARTVQLQPPALRSGFGSLLAAGDFNADGYADLVAVSPTAAGPGVRPYGSVTVFAGSASGLHGGARVTFGDGTPSSPDWFGKSLAVGDLNGDGHDDLAVGAGDLPRSSIENTVQVFLGSTRGLRTPAVQIIRQDDPALGLGDAREAFLGEALAIGDNDGDGHAELVISAPDAGAPDEPGCSDNALCSGVVIVLHGTSTGPSTQDPLLLWGRKPGLPGPRDTAAAFGRSLAAGDLNGDGRADLAIGANGNPGGVYAPGSVVVVYSGSGGLTSRGAQLWNQSSRGIKGKAEPMDRFGATIRIADLGRSTRADLILGVPAEDVGSVTDAGAVQILYGGPTGVTSGDQVLTQASRHVPGTVELYDTFGSSL